MKGKTKKQASDPQNRGSKKKGARLKGELAERTIAIARASKQRLEETHQSLDYGEWLYHENGLPK